MDSNSVSHELDAIQEWIDRQPGPYSPKVVEQNFDFDFEHDFERLDAEHLLDPDYYALNECHIPNGSACAVAQSTAIEGISEPEPRPEPGYGTVDPQSLTLGRPCDLDVSTFMPMQDEHMAFPELDIIAEYGAPDGALARRVTALERECKELSEQLTLLKSDLHSFQKWMGHMSYVVNEMQLRQQGFSPIMKTFGILLPSSLQPPVDENQP